MDTVNKEDLKKLGMTEEEYIKMSDKFFEDYRITKKAIVECINKGGNNPGTMSCPVCKTGILKYSQARGYNNYVHAKCSKKGCIKFVE